MTREIGTPATAVRDAPLSNLSFEDECALLAFLYEQEAIRLLRETSFIDAGDRRSQALLNFTEARHALVALAAIVSCSPDKAAVALRLDVDQASSVALSAVLSGVTVLEFRFALAALMTGFDMPEPPDSGLAGQEARAGDFPLRAFIAAAAPVWQPESVARSAADYAARRTALPVQPERAGFDAMMNLVVETANRRFSGTAGARDFHLLVRMHLHAMTNAFEACRSGNGLLHVANLVAVGCERLMSAERPAPNH